MVGMHDTHTHIYTNMYTEQKPVVFRFAFQTRFKYIAGCIHPYDDDIITFENMKELVQNNNTYQSSLEWQLQLSFSHTRFCLWHLNLIQLNDTKHQIKHWPHRQTDRQTDWMRLFCNFRCVCNAKLNLILFYTKLYNKTSSKTDDIK